MPSAERITVLLQNSEIFPLDLTDRGKLKVPHFEHDNKPDTMGLNNNNIQILTVKSPEASKPGAEEQKLFIPASPS